MASDNGASERRRALDRGAFLDRYVIVGLIGRGGMGEVYAAYDPELDRKVAIKLLRTGFASDHRRTEASTRMQREARAIARLSHPNVVVVYDVGTYGESVFIAMEFVQGHTLTYWLHAKRRTWQQVLQVFLQAGRGLAAAHDAGLIHRDFKPDNVMVGRDGQVRVMDFGLARQAVSRPVDSQDDVETSERVLPVDEADGATVILPPISQMTPASDAGIISGDLAITQRGDADELELRARTTAALDMNLTQVGAIVGTPAYMSPEQCTGRPTDARSDQFSFCVALYEALYGERPFGGKTVAALRDSMAAGKLRDPPAQTTVPSWLRRALARGLEVDPAARYPSMAELLATLEVNPAARRRKWLAFAGIAICAAGLGFGVRHAARTQQTMCAGAAERLTGIWEPATAGAAPPSGRRENIRRAFLATGKSYASDAFAGVTRALDRYVAGWVGMYTDACEATHVRGEQSAEVLDLRMGCLQERLAGVKALTDVFASANGVVVENAVSATGALGALDRCADVGLLRAVVKPPDDPTVRTRVDALRRKLPELKALADSGQCKSGLDPAHDFLERARAVGYGPVLAEALNVVAFLETECGDLREAERVLKQAVWTAEGAHHDQVAAEASVLMVVTVGANLGRLDEAQEWAEHARAAIERIGGDKRLESWLLNGIGTAFYAAGRPGEALDQTQRAVSLKREIYGNDDQDVARSLTNAANALNDLGRLEEARAAHEKALGIFEQTLGPEHPQVALVLGNLGEVLNGMGRYDAARRAFERALKIWRATGAAEFFQAFSITGLGQSYLAEGRAEEARPYLERAMRMRETSDPDPARLAEVHFAMAQALWSDAAARTRARRLADQAKGEYQKRDSAGRKVKEVDEWLAAHGESRPARVTSRLVSASAR